MMLTRMNLRTRRLLMLFIGGVAGVYAVLPHPANHLGEFLAAAIVIGVAAAVGTYLAPRLALESPALDALLTGRPFLHRSLVLAAWGLFIGIVTSLVVIALEALLFAPRLTATPLKGPPLWTGALYALAGGISEEVVFHFGLLSGLAFVAQRVMSAAPAYWSAIALSALALGLSHLPTTAALLPLTAPVATRTVVLVALGGLVSGWLYWRRGLEIAMIAHGVVSFVIHVAVPGAFWLRD